MILGEVDEGGVIYTGFDKIQKGGCVMFQQIPLRGGGVAYLEDGYDSACRLSADSADSEKKPSPSPSRQ